MTGCKSEMEKTIEETLYQKYGEEFEVHYVMAAGQVFTAECSPVDNEEIIFNVRIEDDETPDESDEYAQAYIAYQLTERYKEDLSAYFPNAYFHSRMHLPYGADIPEFKNQSLEDFFGEVNPEESTIFLDIYYYDDEYYPQKYEEEFDYFTRINDENILRGKAVPITVTIYKVTPEIIDNLRQFYKSNITWNKGDLSKDVFGYDFREGNINKNNDLGRPEHISACFDKNAPSYLGGNIDEYIRRRELLDNE